MKQVIVTYRNRTEPSKKSVNNNLQWYDPIKKELQHFEGGHLQFEYKEDEYLVALGASERLNRGVRSTFRLLPKVSDLEIKCTVKSLDDKMFGKFFDNYLNYNTSKITVNISKKTSAICEVPNEEVEDFTYQLERQGFQYEIS